MITRDPAITALQAVYSALANSPVPLSNRSIGQAIGRGEDYARRAVNALLDAGLVVCAQPLQPGLAAGQGAALFAVAPGSRFPAVEFREGKVKVATEPAVQLHGPAHRNGYAERWPLHAWAVQPPWWAEMMRQCGAEMTP